MGAEKRVSKVMAESSESGWFLLERSRTEVEIHVCIELEVIIAKEILREGWHAALVLGSLQLLQWGQPGMGCPLTP